MEPGKRALQRPRVIAIGRAIVADEIASRAIEARDPVEHQFVAGDHPRGFHRGLQHHQHGGGRVLDAFDQLGVGGHHHCAQAERLRDQRPRLGDVTRAGADGVERIGGEAAGLHRLARFERGGAGFEVQRDLLGEQCVFFERGDKRAQRRFLGFEADIGAQQRVTLAGKAGERRRDLALGGGVAAEIGCGVALGGK